MPRPSDPVAQVLVIVILGSLVYAIIEGAYTDWRARDPRPVHHRGPDPGRFGSVRLPLLVGGVTLMISTNSMSRLTGSSPDSQLLITFGLFGVGMGLVNGQISVAPAGPT